MREMLIIDVPEVIERGRVTRLPVPVTKCFDEDDGGQKTLVKPGGEKAPPHKRSLPKGAVADRDGAGRAENMFRRTLTTGHSPAPAYNRVPQPM